MRLSRDAALAILMGLLGCISGVVLCWAALSRLNYWDATWFFAVLVSGVLSSFLALVHNYRTGAGRKAGLVALLGAVLVFAGACLLPLPSLAWIQDLSGQVWLWWAFR